MLVQTNSAGLKKHPMRAVPGLKRPKKGLNSFKQDKRLLKSKKIYIRGEPAQRTLVLEIVVGRL